VAIIAILLLLVITANGMDAAGVDRTLKMMDDIDREFAARDSENRIYGFLFGLFAGGLANMAVLGVAKWWSRLRASAAPKPPLQPQPWYLSWPIIAGAALALTAIAYPPWSQVANTSTIRKTVPCQRALLLTPPQPVDRPYGVELDTPRLLSELLVIALATGVAMAIAARFQRPSVE
jgi:hypothetical protein